jgi:periplasmic protein TonB
MRRVLLLSVGLHVLALASLLAVRQPAPPEPDEPARIEVVFGNGGAAPSPSGAVAAPGAVAGTPRPPDPAAGDPDRAAAGLAALARPATEDPGLRVERPDPLMIPARDAVGNHAPDYPEAARRLHQQGTVLLRLHIGTDGSVTRIETLRSSGVGALDAAAAAALAQWHFLPAERAGQAVASYRDQPVSFVLD